MLLQQQAEALLEEADDLLTIPANVTIETTPNKDVEDLI